MLSEFKDLNTVEQARGSYTHLNDVIPEALREPKVAVVCGSGLGGLVEAIHDSPRFEVSYKDIPHFPESTVAGHQGKLVFGFIGSSKTPIMLLVGRAHFYEGHSIEAVTFATRVCRGLGVSTIVMTNAAGGLSPDFVVGDIVAINDHLNIAGIAGFHPLRGPNNDEIGVRFPPMSDAYDLELRRRAHKAWIELGFAKSGRRLHEGIYAFAAGPSYETRAECRMLRNLGADLVGMSTVPEVIVARHSGMRVLAFSLVTNKAVVDPVPRGDDAELQGMTETELADFLAKGRANHEEVLMAGKVAAVHMQELVKKIIEDFSADQA